jgi:hypothetical protein
VVLSEFEITIVQRVDPYGALGECESSVDQHATQINVAAQRACGKSRT